MAAKWVADVHAAQCVWVKKLGDAVLILKFWSNISWLGLINEGLKTLDAVNQPAQRYFVGHGPPAPVKPPRCIHRSTNCHARCRNVSTIEDPIEMVEEALTRYRSIAQWNWICSGRARTLMRQDPDIIMIGEIRDQRNCRYGRRGTDDRAFGVCRLCTNDAPVRCRVVGSRCAFVFIARSVLLSA